MRGNWTIDGLVAEAERALASTNCKEQASGRVRDLPDKRTVRYYTTLGLLDRPAEMRGRTAYYGRRHLLQLLAIKRLQSQGVALGTVQRQLAGADDQTLMDLCGLPDGWPQAGVALGHPDLTQAPQAAEPEKNHAFWAATPEVSQEFACPAPATMAAPRSAVHLDIAQGATLILEGVDPARLGPEALSRLGPAMEHLSQVLRELKLTEPGTGDEPPFPNGPARDHFC